jgi:glycine hydroxymethyltransferase
VRLGTPSVTSRGMKEPEMAKIASWFSRVGEAVGQEDALDKIAAEVRDVCAGFPAPGIAL